MEDKRYANLHLAHYAPPVGPKALIMCVYPKYNYCNFLGQKNSQRTVSKGAGVRNNPERWISMVPIPFLILKHTQALI